MGGSNRIYWVWNFMILTQPDPLPKKNLLAAHPSVKEFWTNIPRKQIFVLARL